MTVALGMIAVTAAVVLVAARELFMGGRRRRPLTPGRIVLLILTAVAAGLWYWYHAEAAITLLAALVAVTTVEAQRLPSNSLGRPGLLGLRSFLHERGEARRALAARLGLSVRELMKRRDLLEGGGVQPNPFAAFTAVWSKRER